MPELLLSAMLTLLPDYLFRRYVQGKRIGHEITLFSVWYELRWGIVSCAALAITLATVIFYFHPAATNVISAFRTVSVISDRPGRVAEVFVENNQRVRAGDPLFRLETLREEAAAQTAQRRIAEIDAALVEATIELKVIQGTIFSAEAALREARDDLRRRQAIFDRNPVSISEQEIVRLQSIVEQREGDLDVATARRDAIQTNLNYVFPAQRERAEAELAQAQVEIDQSTVLAGTNGTLEQFALRKGDIVSPVLRPAGILVPENSGKERFVAAFPQISAQVVRTGMVTEISCPSRPLAVIPMRVVEIQEFNRVRTDPTHRPACGTPGQSSTRLGSRLSGANL